MALGETAAVGELAPMVGHDGAVAVTWEAADHTERPRNWLVDIALGKNTLALVDQAVVSGTSFLTTVLIARWANVRELGIYALGFSAAGGVDLCSGIALIATPYTIYRHRAKRGTQAEYAGNVLIHQGLLSALVVIVLAVAVGLMYLAGAVPELITVIGVLAAVTPFVLLREFGRRFAFAPAPGKSARVGLGRGRDATRHTRRACMVGSIVRRDRARRAGAACADRHDLAVPGP